MAKAKLPKQDRINLTLRLTLSSLHEIKTQKIKVFFFELPVEREILAAPYPVVALIAIKIY